LSIERLAWIVKWELKCKDATAAVSFSGLVATGLFQVNLVVPALAAGDYAVTVSVNGAGNLGTAVLPVR
jgi:uncharacterized protein (TIGR03437 family)